MASENRRFIKARNTREKILESAMILLSEKTFEEVSVDDICRNAKVSVGAFYHHFPGKDSLINEAYKAFDSLLEAEWNSFHPGDAAEEIFYLISYQMKTAVEMGYHAMSQFYKNQLSDDKKYILDPKRFFNERIHKLTEELCYQSKLNGNPSQAADDILSYCRGMIYDWCLHKGNYLLYDKVRNGVEMTLEYYSKKH